MKDKNQNIVERLSLLEKDHKSLIKEIQNLVNIEVFVSENSVGEKDRIWLCEKCKFKLAVIDTNSKEIRIRYKDFYTWVKIGDLGELKLICRGCSQMNILSYNDIIN